MNSVEKAKKHQYRKISKKKNLVARKITKKNQNRIGVILRYIILQQSCFEAMRKLPKPLPSSIIQAMKKAEFKQIGEL